MLCLIVASACIAADSAVQPPQLSLDDFLKIAYPDPSATHPSQPDLLIAMSDEPDDAHPSKKRLFKSIQRSLQWTSKTIQTASQKKSNAPPVLAHLVGSSLPASREAFSRDLVDPDSLHGTSLPFNSLDDALWGYVLRVPPLSRIYEADEVCRLFNTSLAPLSRHKFRLALCPPTPHAILRLVRDVGIDTMTEDLSYKMADVGVALDFDFGCSTTVHPGEKRDYGLDLYHTHYTHDFSQLSSSSLAETSRRLQPITRAYLHHLLTVHELTAHILLTLHNTRVLNAFMASIRSAISQGGDAFRQACDRFFDTYTEPPPGELPQCQKESTLAKALVSKERGKGRKMT